MAASMSLTKISTFIRNTLPKAPQICTQAILPACCTMTRLQSMEHRVPLIPGGLHRFYSAESWQSSTAPTTTSHQQVEPEVTDEADVLYKSVEIEAKGHELAVLDSYEKFCCLAAKELGLNMANVWTPPRNILRRTLLKSKHIYKKHRVQYEIRTYFRVFQLKHITGCSADTYLEYIQRNLPEGMAMKVTRNRLEAIPDHIQPPEDFAGKSDELPYPPYNKQS
ncbi:unnamed protein product [Owenia fusiformis]|uniref:Small ribosomal subunit protein uS10m n=1 Tax=Owenia fusiformis TaxID=6347 RepID=A0A8J1U213_OWEFU|nr:unnamed protein product [Owenia fusiformis]